MGNTVNKNIKSEFLKSFQQRLKSTKDGKLRVGPELVRIGINRLCNFNCVTCWTYSSLFKEQRLDRVKDEMIDPDLVLNLIDDLAAMKCDSILFSGRGEPFGHPRIMDFIKWSRQKKLAVFIQTNLSLVKDPKKLAKYLGPGQNLICVHLSAATPNTYAKIHPGQTIKDFYKILDKIKILRNRHVPVRLVYVVNKLNYNEILEVFKLNEELKTYLHLEVMDYELKGGLGKIAITKNEGKSIINFLNYLRKAKKHRMTSNIKEFINQLTYSSLGIEKLSSCCLGYFFSTIDEAGHVNYCFNRDKKFYVGNLTENSFSDIWSSKRYSELRNRLLNGDFLDSCKECIKGRGYNFKLHTYIDPTTRDLNKEGKILEYE